MYISLGKKGVFIYIFILFYTELDRMLLDVHHIVNQEQDL